MDMDLSLITDWLSTARDWIVTWWPAIVGGIVGVYAYYILARITIGVGFWPKSSGRHWLHVVEGCLFPLTWTIAFAIWILRLLFGRAGEGAENIGKKLAST